MLAIKQTLYRTSGDSPIVQGAMEAAENGKQVTAIVELKARFDEAANVSWATTDGTLGRPCGLRLYGPENPLQSLAGRAAGGRRVRRYVHLSTGNYNPTTALMYTDIGLFTADEEIRGRCLGVVQSADRILARPPVAQVGRALRRSARETMRADRRADASRAKGRPSRIFAKLNSIVDPASIDALYRASQAGVPIDLIVRGICCLRPGIDGISENIRVRSIVDRFLEHSRILVFGPDDSAKIFVSSATGCHGTFYRRVEVMFPIESRPLRKRLLSEIIPAYLADNVKARRAAAGWQLPQRGSGGRSRETLPCQQSPA